MGKLSDKRVEWNAEPAQPVQAPDAKQYRAKIFKSGNSVALRLPAELGLAAGTEVDLRVESDGRYSFAPASAPKRKFPIDKVWGCAIGSGLELIKPEDRVFRERKLIWDDPEWVTRNMPDE